MREYDENTKEFVEKTLSRIMLLQKHQESVMAAVHCVLNERDCNFGNLIEVLYRAEVKEWRNLFMFGLVVDDETRDRIKVAAYERFLDDHIHVSNFWTNSSDWLHSSEEEFRRMCKSLFAPAEAKKMDKELMQKLGVKPPREKTMIEKISNLNLE